MSRYNIAVIPGDGVGIEVIEEGLATLEAVAKAHGGLSFEFTRFPWGCRYYLEKGKMMDEDGLKILRDFDAIYLGAVGFPGVPDHISLWGLLLPIRQEFEQYVNLRPIKLFPGVTGPLRSGNIDMICVRENTEGEYAGVGGRMFNGTPQELALQTAVFTRRGMERVMRFAFDYARKNGRQKVTSITKSNACNYSMVFWDEVFAAVSRDYPDIRADQLLVDAAAALFVTRPERFDVVVASNLFGDILTDLGAALQGGIGLAPSANLNPERKYPSMFEPVHGSAPDIAGKGVANPVGAIWSAQMMLEHLGEVEAAGVLMKAIADVLAGGEVRTPDMGGKSTTTQVGEAIRQKILIAS
ncbi:tartrate dehydrogenase/decarboxylase/D-malate dehydrogenase [Desulfofundulus luciae]|uniref:D-malate dehydrogenase (decarboxylating) n=1 Tax=Desulfofundulus luciae TaxID=74702 RepID=A0ABU0AZA5_9FIRM|nr:tartrate dehydrogenase [Desulfofundulus luciae]MDQ0285382.1 tartrate dehydrogenase/decarboxylase/D-malate dehydrogenase [Desulfofundulus luciae]